jgi:hypothetical protein
VREVPAVNAVVALRSIAADWHRIPDYLPSDTAPRADLLGRTGSKVFAPLPIRADVSDLIAVIARRTVTWEGMLREACRMGPPYWTRPRSVAVPESLRWSAGIIETPPQVKDERGFDAPRLIPHSVALTIEEEAITLSQKVSRVVAAVVFAPQRLVCPACDCPTLFYDRVADKSRCVRCGTEGRAA